ncbi:MAG: hypothetical protein ACE5KO_03070 [Candidatus Bathyarchaeia archaeon]
MLTVKFVGELRSLAQKETMTLQLNNEKIYNIQNIIVEIASNLDGSFCEELLGKNGSDTQLRSRALILKNNIEIGALEGLQTIVCDGDNLVLIPIAHGG